MRIRKRLLSLYGAVIAPPSSDLHAGNQQPPPRVQQLHPNGNQCHRPLPLSSSDHTTQIGLQPSTCVSSGDSSHPNTTKIFNELESERKKLKEVIKTDYTGCRKESILCAEANNHDLVVKGWLQGDRLVPTKKKRGSYGRKLNKDVVQDNKSVMSSMKNNKEGAVIMEGSRCSRVNGRGWRCSQQTLVGYSLCEHHLGKGRVRSMTRVRAKTIARKDKKVESPSLIDHDFDDDDDEEEEEEFEDWDVESTSSSIEGRKVFSKNKKLGVVKARSLSSLLSQISS